MRIGEIRGRWAKLRYWEKGAILGGGLHLVALTTILIANFVFVPRTPPPGSGDMGTLLGWLLAMLFWLIEFIPYYLFGTVIELHIHEELRFYSPKEISILVFYAVYSTTFYALLGMAVAKIIEFLKATHKRVDDDSRMH